MSEKCFRLMNKGSGQKLTITPGEGNTDTKRMIVISNLKKTDEQQTQTNCKIAELYPNL